MLRTDIWGAQRSQFSGPKSLHWSHCTFERWLPIVDPPHDSESWLLILSMLIAFPPPPDQQNVNLGWIDKIVDCWSSVLIVNCPPPTPNYQNADLGWIDKIVDCWSSVLIVNHPPPPKLPKCRSGVDWQNCWLLIFCVDCQWPYFPWTTKMRIWGGLTKLLIVDPLFWSLIPSPPHDRHKTCSCKMITLSGTVPNCFSLISWLLLYLTKKYVGK